MKVTRIILLVFILIIGCDQFYSQTYPIIDSLNDVIKIQTDTNRIKSVVNLGWELYNIGDNIQARQKLSEAIKLAQEKKLDRTIAKAEYLLGLIELNQSNYDEALKYFFKIETYYKKVNHKTNLASVYNDIGVVYFRIGDYNLSVDYYKKAMKMNEELGQKSGVSAALTNIGGIYYIQGKMKDAIEYCFKSLQLERELGNKKGEISSLTTIAITYEATQDTAKAIEYHTKSCKLAEQIQDKDGMAYSYSNFGTFYINHKQVIKALEYLEKSLKLFEEIGDKSGIAVCLSGMGECYFIQTNYKDALVFLDKALKLNQDINNNEGIVKNTNLLAHVYFKTNAIDQSILFANRALAMAQTINSMSHVLFAHELLSDAYAAKNQSALALYHYKRKVTIHDSLFNIDTRKNIAELQTKYNSEIKDKENKELLLANEIQSLQLSKTKYIVAILLTVLLIVFLLGYILLKRNKLKHERESLIMEQKLLRSQMNPHFIFNALIAIESFIYKNEPREAGSYLSKFAKLMRLILENSREEYITLEKEIQTLENYFKLQQLRFDNSFSYTIEVSDDIDVDLVRIPPMLAQPFIENSIEHGLKNISHEGNVLIKFSIADNDLVFEISDNGIGFKGSMGMEQDPKEHESMATKITLQRLKNLNRMKLKKIKWLAEDILNEAKQAIGARVIFTIPYKRD